MSSPAEGPDRWLEEAMDKVPRHEAPPVPLEAILERWQTGRRRRAVAGGLLLAAAAMVGMVLVRSPAPEPPVHLELNIVDVTAVEAPLEPGLEQDPQELRVP
ncbi:MAG: hypothetical protein ACYTGV_14950 [Planctomycetota bacterium]|jgi:hypothetical protein